MLLKRRCLLAWPTSLLCLMSGCALQTTAPSSPVEVTAAVQGTVMGGNIPISGASIYLVAIGEVGYGVPAATSILATTTTDSNGGFTLPTFSCGGRFTHTLIEARGGNPGLPGSVNNSAIFLAAIPTLLCSDINTTTHIHIDEVTTVAAAYTLRPFVTGNNVGTSSTNVVGLSNAYSTYSNLVNTATGTAPGASVPTGVSVPVATINALANSLTACVNSTGPTSGACSALFTDSGVASTGITANTFNIAVAIASNPQTVNVTDIFNTASTSPPFQPALTVAPSDWTLPLAYTAGNLTSAQTALDIDGNGNVWVSTLGGFAGTLEEVSPAGAMLATNVLNGTLDDPVSLVIDQTGNLAVGNAASGDASVIGYSPSTAARLYKTVWGTIANPSSLAVDTANRVIAGDAQTLAVSYINVPSGGVGLVLYTDAFSTDPAVTISPNGDVFIAGGNDYTIGDNVDATIQVSTDVTGCPTFGPAFDASNALWTFTASALCREPVPYIGTQGQFLSPNNAGSFTSLAIDGLGQLWAGLTGSSSLIEVTPSAASNNYFGSPHNVLLPKSAALSVVAVAIDQSGNVWLANGTTGGLTEVVGAAAPVATPRAIAAKNGSQGTRP